MLKCEINGKHVEVSDDSTVMDAFFSIGEEIAHLCWHPGLRASGGCRLCMVEVEGEEKLQAACTTQICEGMVITNQSEKVKKAVQRNLELHLVNHPLECQVCDKAGECQLQNYYMKYGLYNSAMNEQKTRKPKGVRVGPRIELDNERCTLCLRCLSFVEDVSRSNELALIGAGSESRIEVLNEGDFDNDYSLNTVDICPVGALGSIDFQCRKPVWSLKTFDTVCSGCSTGCNIHVDHDSEEIQRIRPKFNKSVNDHWMCDWGRELFNYVNKEARLQKAIHNVGEIRKVMPSSEALKRVVQELRQTIEDEGPDSVAVVMTGQYTNEEFSDFLDVFRRSLKLRRVYHWINNPKSFDSFDGLLMRGDKNPNTTGLLQTLEGEGFRVPWENLVDTIQDGRIRMLFVAGPENIEVYPDLDEKIKLFSKVENVVWLSPVRNETIEAMTWVLPMVSNLEKHGTVTNCRGLVQVIQSDISFVKSALTLSDVSKAIDIASRLRLEDEQPSLGY